MTGKGHITMAALWIAGICAGASGQSVSVLLERGVHQEETVGDLDAAMKIYRKIVDDAKADRKLIAQAQYRLGVCHLKKKQPARAISNMEELIRAFPEQREVVAKARKVLAAARGRIGGAELAKAVKNAVMVISTCTEWDPRVRKQLDALKGLNAAGVVRELAGHLDAKSNTVRRSAIYILWQGEVADISAAVPKLLRLCQHKEDLTRGMAALALGAKKADAAFQVLCDMTAKDASGYARRCGAYALGLLGRKDARGVLEKACRDKDAVVRSNAEMALKMLAGDAGAGAGAPKVVRTTPGNFANDVDPSLAKVSVTFDRRMADGSWAWVRRYSDKYPETPGRPAFDAGQTTCSVAVELQPGKVYWIGLNTPPYIGFRSADGAPAQQSVRLFATKSADGKPTPIPAKLLADAKAILASAGKPAPTVVSTTPRAFDDNVPPSLDKITVTFDQEMMDQSWSWVQVSDESYPKMTGKPSYDKARRTCTLP